MRIRTTQVSGLHASLQQPRLSVVVVLLADSADPERFKASDVMSVSPRTYRIETHFLPTPSAMGIQPQATEQRFDARSRWAIYAIPIEDVTITCFAAFTTWSSWYPPLFPVHCDMMHLANLHLRKALWRLVQFANSPHSMLKSPWEEQQQLPWFCWYNMFEVTRRLNFRCTCTLSLRDRRPAEWKLSFHNLRQRGGKFPDI